MLPLLMGAALAQAGPAVETSRYGQLEGGQAVEQVTLRNANGMVVKLINYGAIVTDIVVPDKQGRLENVALGFGNLADYEAKNGNYSFGAAVGRYAGRIAGAGFTIDGKEVKLAANDGPNTLHGGPGGFDVQLWHVTPFRSGEDVGAVLTHASPAWQQGFPGRLETKVTYTLTADNALRIDYEATTDAPTALNLTNHSYFNLAGAGSGSVLDHELQVASDRIVDIDQRGIPTGAFVDVAGTPFDFRTPTRIGDLIDRPHRLFTTPKGYNHSWMLPVSGELNRAGILSDPASGRTMEVWTTEPSIHAYTANYFGGEDKGAQGTVYKALDAIALETQHLPDSPNRPAFPSTELRPGETFRSTTIYKFGVE